MQTDEINNRKLFILDMDGTVYLGNRILEGALEFIDKLKHTGKKIVFFTNNASRTPGDYSKKLSGMGIKANESDIITSGDVTIQYIKEKYPGRGVYLLGTPELKKSFVENGIKLVEDTPDVVVVSFDLTLTYDKVRRACRHIRGGAVFLATHMDLNCPTEDGSVPDCGSICAMITASTGVKPRYLGKPSRETIDMITFITGFSTGEMTIIGDRLYTDMAMGVKNGVASILVLTGETKREDLENSDIGPDFVFNSIREVAEFIK